MFLWLCWIGGVPWFDVMCGESEATLQKNLRPQPDCRQRRKSYDRPLFGHSHIVASIKSTCDIATIEVVSEPSREYKHRSTGMVKYIHHTSGLSAILLRPCHMAKLCPSVTNYGNHTITLCQIYNRDVQPSYGHLFN
jgi:hypothetical protein